MLDKRASQILFYLNDQCAEGEYKIFAITELLSQLSGRSKTNVEGLAEDIKYLTEHGYINCKYQDETQYCLVPLNKGRLYTEEASVVKEDRRSKRLFLFFIVLGGALGGFLGGFLWSLIASLI